MAPPAQGSGSSAGTSPEQEGKTIEEQRLEIERSKLTLEQVKFKAESKRSLLTIASTAISFITALVALWIGILNQQQQADTHSGSHG
jgi:hypothetical protein